MKTQIPFKNTQVASGSGLPAANELVTLFNSVTAFGQKALHNLGCNYWFTYAIAPSTNATGNGVTGDYSNDGGVTWNNFYTSTTNEPVGDSTTFIDEVFIGQYMDVRFRFQNGTSAQATLFAVNMSLDSEQRATAAI